MEKQEFFIPEKLKVGFQKRDDTYTGKLGYIIYYDSKGVLRKEKSWNSWRDENIDPLEVSNTPTSGLMLNRHVGGYSTGWNHRQSYCRVWDPRGFEIEITIENLLWILEYCDCSKGKVLSGEFVYAWSGVDLVLLPVSTEEYKNSLEISKKKPSKTLSSSDLIPGALYRIKGLGWEDIEKYGNELVFIGRVKAQKEFGRRYETISLFSSKNEKKFFSLSRTSIDFLDKKDVFTQEQIDEILYRFSLSAYSWDFWNTDKGFIDSIDFINLPRSKNECTYSCNYTDIYYYLKWDLKIDNPECVKCVVSGDNNEFDYYHRYFTFDVKPIKSGYGGYWYHTDTGSKQYPSTRFILEDGKIKIKNVFADHGKISKELMHLWRNHDDERILVLRDFNKVYPESKTISSSTSKLFEGEKKNIIYKTGSGYVSDSLQIVLSLGGGIDGIFTKLYRFDLPEKEKEKKK